MFQLLGQQTSIQEETVSNIKPSKLTQVIPILTCIWEVPYLNPHCSTDYHDEGFSWFFSVTQGE
jgi:hypothetical protein